MKPTSQLLYLKRDAELHHILERAPTMETRVEAEECIALRNYYL